MRGRLGMNTESPMHIMHLPSSRAFNSRGYRQILWYAPSTMVLVLRSGQYRTPRYFDVAHTEDHRVPYALVASCTEHHGIWTSATPWCPVEYRVCCGLRPRLRRLETRLPETSSFPFNQPGVIRPSPMPKRRGARRPAKIKPKAAVGVDFQPQKRSGSSVVTRTTRTATVRVRPWQAVTGCHRLSQLSQLSQAVTRCHTISRV